MYAWDSCVYLECVWMMCISLHYFISLASSSNGVLFVNPPLQCFGRSSIAIFVGPESCNRGLTKVLQRCFGHFWPVCTSSHTIALQYMLYTAFAIYKPIPPALCRESDASGLRSLAWCGAHVWNCWMIVGNRNKSVIFLLLFLLTTHFLCYSHYVTHYPLLTTRSWLVATSYLY